VIDKLRGLLHRLLNAIFGVKEEIPVYNEAQAMLKQIEMAKSKLNMAWNNLTNAEKEYIDIAVIEVHLAESEYSLLHRKYRLLTGAEENREFGLRGAFSGCSLPWLFRNAKGRISSDCR